MYAEVKSIDYEGYPGDLADLEEFLEAKDLLLVLRHGKPPYHVTLGVPHQAAIGTDQICEHRLDESGAARPRGADENAASYALVAFRALINQDIPSKLVIMAHATTHDPNKVPGSPYCSEIFAEETRLLFECHGSGTHRSLALELSAGRNTLSDQVRFGQLLFRALKGRYTLGVQRGNEIKEAFIYGPNGSLEEGVLELPARYTYSLIGAGERNIPAFHLEAKPMFRKSRAWGNGITPDGLILGQAIAHSILEYVR